MAQCCFGVNACWLRQNTCSASEGRVHDNAQGSPAAWSAKAVADWQHLLALLGVYPLSDIVWSDPHKFLREHHMPCL